VRRDAKTQSEQRFEKEPLAATMALSEAAAAATVKGVTHVTHFPILVSKCARRDR
jgi:hypothetical protein